MKLKIQYIVAKWCRPQFYNNEPCRLVSRWALQGLIALGWHIEYGDSDFGGANQRNAAQQSQGDPKNPHNYNPNPADMTNLTLSKEMMNVAERLSEDAHDIQVEIRIMYIHIPILCMYL
jgi:ryanodine receptor 2